MRSIVVLLVVLASAHAQAKPRVVRCDPRAVSELSIDGLLDDWPRAVQGRAGARGGALALRCAWDGNSLGLALDIEDDRVVRVPGKGRGHDDQVVVTVSAGGTPVEIQVLPANAVAKARHAAPRTVVVADSRQPKGFSIELEIPGTSVAGLSPSTPALELRIVYRDADRATGGATTEVTLAATIELSDRKDLLDDFLQTVRLPRRALRHDVLAELDPDRKGRERLVAGGTVIGILTDQFAYVTLPAATPADVLDVGLIPLGRRGLQVVSAVVRQAGNGGSRDLLMLWTVWSGQLHALAQIEVRKVMGANALVSRWKLVKARGKRGPELWVEATPAVGWTADTWHEQAAADADPIVLPWDDARVGVAYALDGAEVTRRDLPRPKKKSRR